MKRASKRATDAEFLQRVFRIKELLQAGTTWAEICHFASSTWHVSERQVARYLQAAKELISKELQHLGVTSTSWHVATRLALYQKAVNSDDFATALRILQDLAKLQGRYPSRPIGDGESVKESDANDRAIQEITSAIAAGDIETAKWWLERRKSEDFGTDRLEKLLDALRKEIDQIKSANP